MAQRVSFHLIDTSDARLLADICQHAKEQFGDTALIVKKIGPGRSSENLVNLPKNTELPFLVGPPPAGRCWYVCMA